MRDGRRGGRDGVSWRAGGCGGGENDMDGVQDVENGERDQEEEEAAEDGGRCRLLAGGGLHCPTQCCRGGFSVGSSQTRRSGSLEGECERGLDGG